MGEPASVDLRISVVSKDAAVAPASTAALQRRLTEEASEAPGKDRWGEPRTVPQPGGPAVQGGLPDVALQFVTDQLAGALLTEAVKSAATYLVWTVVSHLRSQPEPTQKVRLSESGTDHDVQLELSADGLRDEEIARVRTALEEILREAVERQRRDGPTEDED